MRGRIPLLAADRYGTLMDHPLRYRKAGKMNHLYHDPCKPLFRWAGSKRKLLPLLIAKAPERLGCYLEPFAGSACLFFAIRPKRAILSDLNRELIGAYKEIRKSPLQVLMTARSYGESKSDYGAIRSMNPRHLSSFGRAARFLYLNRRCFNALYRTNRKGEFNVPMGTKTGEFPSQEEFVRSAEALKCATLKSSDFEDTLSEAKAGDFVYMDPPYVSRSRIDRNEYGVGSFSHEDVPRLIESLHGLNHRGVHFLLSYSDTPEFVEQLPRRVKSTIDVRRNIASNPGFRRNVRELLLTNKDLFKS